MKRTLILLTAGLLAFTFSSCAPQIITTKTVVTPTVNPVDAKPVTVVPPAPAPVIVPSAVVPVPVIVPVTGPLNVLDSSILTVSLTGGTLNIELNDNVKGTWMRIKLPDGTISPVTASPGCECLGLGLASSHGVNVSFLAGMSIETALDRTGPWIVAAYTK
jgi:hypothetical protein